MIVTQQQIMAAGVKPEVADTWLKPIQQACAEFGIESDKQIATFLGQCAHETGGFRLLEENLNYSADTMAAVWPNRFAEKGPDGKYILVNGKKKPNKFALALHRQPEPLANVVYSNRMGNGSIESGEGWLYRGRGLKQLTGKDNYSRCGKALGIDLIHSPDLLLAPFQAARSAAWFYKTNNISAYAESWDLAGMTKKINGGLIGFDDRKKRCEAVLACTRTA
jgi:putative chitinase